MADRNDIGFDLFYLRLDVQEPGLAQCSCGRHYTSTPISGGKCELCRRGPDEVDEMKAVQCLTWNSRKLQAPKPAPAILKYRAGS